MPLNRMLNIDDIVVDYGFNLRNKLDKQIISEYKERLDYMPPVIVYETERGYILVDGFHRLAAAKQDGRNKINAEVKQGSVNDSLAHACIANLRHGKPLENDERQRAIKLYIKLNVNNSNRMLAEAVGCSEATIRRYRSDMEHVGEIEKAEKRVGKDKKVRETTASLDAVADNATSDSELEPDPYEEWIGDHLLQGDTFDILNDMERRFDLAIVDPPYGITDEEWDKIDILSFTRKWLNLVLGRLKPTGRLYVFFSRKYVCVKAAYGRD